MVNEIIIYGQGGNRSARVAWTINELDLTATYRNHEGLIGSEELKQLHPQGKIPSAQLGQLVLFESAAICQHLCDGVPDNTLLAQSGTDERSKHSQWVSFAQSEIESYLWHSFQLTRQDPEGKSSAFAKKLNLDCAFAGLNVLENHLSKDLYLLGDSFTLTDIIVGWTINWGRKSGLLDSSPSLNAYLNRLFARPNIALEW
jgi:glutathione S-transferase